MFFDFQTNWFSCFLISSVNHSVCLLVLKLHDLWRETQKKPENTVLVNFLKFVVVSYSYADSVAVRSNHFLLVKWLFDAKVLLNGHAVTQNYVFVVFQSEATRNNSHD